MDSTDKNFGKLSLIDSDDDSDDGATASGVKSGVKHAVTEEEHEPKLGNSGISSLKPRTKTFNGLEARKLLTFFNDELQDETDEMSITKDEKKEWITLSSCIPSLLDTEKQRLQKLLDTLTCQKMGSFSKPQNEIDSIIESQNLKLLMSQDEDGQLIICFKDLFEYKQLMSSMKQASSTRRRNRTFQSSENARSLSASGTSNSEKDMYASEFEWQSKNKDDNHAVTREDYDSFSTTFLGENVQVKREIRQNGICTKIYQGSIIKAKVDAIVNAANERLDNCGGVAEVIAKAAGSEMELECRSRMGQWSKIKVSENIVTSAGKLPCRWIIHAVGPRWSDYNDKEEALQSLYKTVVNILATASKRQMKSVVMPPISSGIFGVPKQACAAMYIKSLLDFSEEYQEAKVKEFHFIDNKMDMLDLISEEYEESHKNGRKYLEPKKVLERLQIPSHKKVWKNNSASNPSSSFRTNTRSAENGKNSIPKAEQRGHTFQKYILKEIAPGEYTIGDILKVVVFTENILKLKNVDILVCAEGKDKNVSGRIAKTVLEKVTIKEKKQIQKIISGTQHYSDVLQTNFGVDGYNMIFFAIVRRFGDGKPRHEDLKLLEKTTSTVLEKANKKRKSGRKNAHLSVAVPLLGTGSTKNTGYLQDYANVMCDSIVEFRKHIEDKTRLRTINLVNFAESATNALVQAFKSRLASQTVKQNTFNTFSPMSASNLNPKRSQFDRTKYKLKEEWKAKEKPKYDFNSFIKGVDRQKKTLQENNKDSGNDATGNLVVIESDEESETEQSKEGACLVVAKTEANKIVDPDNDDLVFDDSSLTCVICMDTELEAPVMLKTCHHQFCRDCIEDYFSHKPICPVCNMVYGELFGNQPSGTATVYKDYASLPGFPCPTLIIDYNIPDGTQTEEHPNPGQPFTGVSRQAYLPDNDEGNMVLGMLERAFKHRLIFTVGFSRTSGKDNMVTWNDIHHKTRREGGPEKFGYPDLEYIERVKEELAAKGITEN